MMVFAIGKGVNELALVVFAVVLAITLVITFRASKRITNTTEFFAAGRSITGVQNGIAMAGDYPCEPLRWGGSVRQLIPGCRSCHLRHPGERYVNAAQRGSGT